jgi:tight adherence protein C
VLVQAERFGTSVARALRAHAELVRVRRMQRAEEKAARVSPTLTIIMIVFILPCLIVILVGPAVINVKNVLIPSMSAAP